MLSRPGRPPKRSPVGDMLSSASESPTRDDSRTGTPSPSLDSSSSGGGIQTNSIGNINSIRPNSRDSQQQSNNNYNSKILASGLTSAATNALLNGSSLINNNNIINSSTNNINSGNSNNHQQRIDFSAALSQVAQAANNNSEAGNGVVTTTTNSLNALLETSLLASKLAQQHQQLLGPSNPNSLLNNGPNATGQITSASSQHQQPQLVQQPSLSQINTTSSTPPTQNQTTIANPLNGTSNPFNTAPANSHPAINQAAAAAAAAANMYLSPNLLNDGK